MPLPTSEWRPSMIMIPRPWFPCREEACAKTRGRQLRRDDTKTRQAKQTYLFQGNDAKVLESGVSLLGRLQGTVIRSEEHGDEGEIKEFVRMNTCDLWSTYLLVQCDGEPGDGGNSHILQRAFPPNWRIDWPRCH